MNKLRFSLTALAVMAFSLVAFSSAQAQSRTWVSGVGDDMNPCSRTAPCKTFAGAISKTAVNGEINCLDPGAYGGLTITKSIQVDCHENFAGVTHPSANGVSIAFDSFAGTDTRKSVRLRNINYSGVDTGLRGVSITGGAAVTGGCDAGGCAGATPTSRAASASTPMPRAPSCTNTSWMRPRRRPSARSSNCPTA